MEEPLAKIDDEQEPDLLRKLLAFDLVGTNVINPRCKVCNSLYRKEAEGLYDEGKTFAEIKQFFEDNKDPIPVNGIQHHMKEHYRNMERTALLLEFCDRLEHIQNKRRGRKKDLELMVDMCLLDLARVASMPTGGKLEKEKVKIELAVKVRQDMRSHIQALNDMEEQAEAIRSVEVKFANAWKQCIESAASPTEKQMFAQALREFERTLRDQQ